MTDLFEETPPPPREGPPPPLAERMRPATPEEFLGQDEILGKGKPLTRILESGGTPPSLLLWGPPGSGKTTLARLLASRCGLHFVQFSAVTSGIKDVKEVVEEAKRRRAREGKGTILFVDEIHRFNRAQQDAFLPHIEAGTLVLIGATTENPSFEVNSALLSRCRVVVLKALPEGAVRSLLERALADEKRGLGSLPIRFAPDALDEIVLLSNGDARIALNLLEVCAATTAKEVTTAAVRELAQRRTLSYDHDREEHFNTISAFIKSIRGSDPDAALYWLARMLEAGEDPLFIARRLVILASEDVGNADPRGIMVAVAARDAVDFVGMPEGYLPLAQAVTYLATAPKSNASYVAYLRAKEDVERTRNDPVPLHLRNAPTALMKNLEYGKGYLYPHDQADATVRQEYRPANVQERVYYEPVPRGYEITIRKLMEERKKKKGGDA